MPEEIRNGATPPIFRARSTAPPSTGPGADREKPATGAGLPTPGGDRGGSCRVLEEPHRGDRSTRSDAAPGFRTRALAWLARRFGPAFVLPTVDTLEQMDSGTYDAQPEAVAGGLRPPSDHMPASSRRWLRARRARSAAPLWHVWRAGTAEWAAMRCVPRY